MWLCQAEALVGLRLGLVRPAEAGGDLPDGGDDLAVSQGRGSPWTRERLSVAEPIAGAAL